MVLTIYQAYANIDDRKSRYDAVVERLAYALLNRWYELPGHDTTHDLVNELKLSAPL